KLEKIFHMCHNWVGKRAPEIDEAAFRQIPMYLDPVHENPWISGRNSAAHKVTVAEATATSSRQGDYEGERFEISGSLKFCKGTFWDVVPGCS
ncbi:hypothetical protein MMC07_009848, partial [Pseudocyphellaria aurata]|nr:hypothetical protein [Pseudocyphellaria aurata]